MNGQKQKELALKVTPSVLTKQGYESQRLGQMNERSKSTKVKASLKCL